MRKLLFTTTIVYFIFLISCKEKVTGLPSNTSAKKKQEKRIDIELIGTLEFRRSYADIQFMDDEKEIDKFIEQQDKTDPAIIHPVDSFLLGRFKDLGLVKNKGIILKNFIYDTARNTSLYTSVGQKIDLRFNIDLSSGKHTLTANFFNDSARVPIRISDMLIGPQYAILDIVPGGEKELVLLDQYYIMNGDNFDFDFYEIKIK